MGKYIGICTDTAEDMIGHISGIVAGVKNVNLRYFVYTTSWATNC